MKKLRILGVMTGTSCDGLDAACIEIDPKGWRPLWSAACPYPSRLRDRVLSIQKPGNRSSLQDIMKLNADLGTWYGEQIGKMTKKSKQKPDLIANHGQTVAHFPADGATLQLGDASRIAVATGLTVASNFREGDLASGGQGAPLVPLFHRIIASSLKAEAVAIHNIGGISNLTWIGPKSETLAFDTGPGNIWIDAAASRATRGKEKMDRDGKLALKGLVDQRAMERLLKHPYFAKPAPKSTGRDDFSVDLFFEVTRGLSGPDQVATATALTIESIGRAYEKEIIKRGKKLDAILFCGGGAKNPVLLEGLAERLPDCHIAKLGDYGFDEQLIEAQAFAFFGFMAILGKPIGGSWTGSKEFGPPAHLIPGKNWSELREKLARF